MTANYAKIKMIGSFEVRFNQLDLFKIPEIFKMFFYEISIIRIRREKQHIGKSIREKNKKKI